MKSHTEPLLWLRRLKPLQAGCRPPPNRGRISCLCHREQLTRARAARRRRRSTEGWCTRARRFGRVSLMNQGLRLIQKVVRQDGWGSGMKLRPVVRPGANGRLHRRLGAAAQIRTNGVGSHQQSQPDVGKERAHRRVPERRALLARRPVAAGLVAPGIAEAHRHDRDLALVVEGGPVDRQPRAEHVAAAVVEREPALMGAGSGRLADDHQPRPAGAAHHRPRSEREFGCAHATTGNLAEKSGQRVFGDALRIMHCVYMSGGAVRGQGRASAFSRRLTIGGFNGTHKG